MKSFSILLTACRHEFDFLFSTSENFEFDCLPRLFFGKVCPVINGQLSSAQNHDLLDKASSCCQQINLNAKL